MALPCDTQLAAGIRNHHVPVPEVAILIAIAIRCDNPGIVHPCIELGHEQSFIAVICQAENDQIQTTFQQSRHCVWTRRVRTDYNACLDPFVIGYCHRHRPWLVVRFFLDGLQVPFAVDGLDLALRI